MIDRSKAIRKAGDFINDAPVVALKDYQALLTLTESLVGALKGLSDMYTHAWDLVDGGLIMMDGSIPKFEKAHKKAEQALSQVKLLMGSE